VPRTRPRAGRKWMVEPYDLVASATEIRAGTLTASDWARSFSGVQEGAWWARDDPLPFYAMCATLGWHAVGYRSRRRRTRLANRQAGTGRAIEPGRSPQGVVDRFFDGAANYWLDIYRQDGLQGVIYRERMEAALRWIRDVRLPAGARVLEVGCGAGLTAAELGRSGFEVTATDSSIEMVKKAQRHAEEAGVVDAVRVVHADAHRMPFAAEQFDVVVALGLLPWLHDPQQAVREMIRLLSPGGWIVVTADNRTRLNLIVEPRENPLLTPIKVTRRGIKRAAGRAGDGATSHLHLPGQVELMLRSAGAVPVRRTTVGFGPFTFLGRSLLNDATGLRLHRWLEHSSEHRMPAARRLGWHYLVAAQKPEH
jgi:SAM-dependent methyltransferase